MIILYNPKEIFFFRKPVNILLNVYFNKKTFLLKISRDENISYDYIVRVIKFFEDKGFVSTEKKQRCRYIYISEKGKRICEKFLNLKEVIKNER